MEEEISPTVSLHKFIAVCQTDEQREQLRLAILSGGPDCDLDAKDERGYSALHWAVFVENVEVVRLLAQLNVDPFVRDLHFGLTALDYAVGSRLSVPVARCILENYPEEDIKRLLLDTDKLGETCLHKATQSASFDSVILLVNSGALASKKNKSGRTAVETVDKDASSAARIVQYLKNQMTRENMTKCWFCHKMSQIGTKRCSRCHYARYCNRECQVADWKEHKKSCEPVVLAKANGHFIHDMLEEENEAVDDTSDFIIARAQHKNGSVKAIQVNTAGDLHNAARDEHRKLQRSHTAKTEFTALVQIPKNIPNGPLLVKDTKKSFVSFVTPSEQGYKILVSKINKNSLRGHQSAYFRCEFDSAFPGTTKIFASTCASSL